MRIALISCEIFYREMCAAIARAPHRVDAHFLPKGLHDMGAEQMQARLQAAVDEIPDDAADVIAMGYALCNNGLRGLAARDRPLVVPRAHDCISLFMGSRHRYADYFRTKPGTYFKTTGWIERGDSGDGSAEMRQLSITHRQGLDRDYDALVAQYGADNAEYLASVLGDHTANYSNLAFIEMGVEGDDRFERQSRELARQRGWSFDHLQGDMGLIERLLKGDWDDDDFLVVPPGSTIEVTYDDRIFEARTA